MSNRKATRAKRQRSTTPPAGPTVRVSDILNTALGARVPDHYGATSPVAVVNDDGRVLSRMEMTAVIVNLATVAHDTFQLLGADERAQLTAAWTQMATEVRFDDIVTAMAAGG